MGSPPTMFPVFYCALFLGAFTAANTHTITGSQSEEETRGSCPSGWTDGSSVGMGCLLFDSSQGYTWDKANDFCHSNGANLVEIRSVGAMEYVKMMLDFIDDHENPQYWWTSGTDLGVENRWVWQVSLQEVGPYVWFSGQPNADGNCLYLHPDKNYMGGDADCANQYRPICEQK